MIRKKITFAAATFAVSVLAVLLLIYEPYASEAVRETLGLFFHRVLPPLFPYMVLSRMIVSMDLLSPVGKRMNLPRLFRLPEKTASVLLTGLLCGFPVGAAGTCTLYENGEVGKHDAGRLAALSSNTSPAFLLGTVAALWNSRIYGIFLFGVQTISALALAFLFARLTVPDTENVRRKEEPSDRCGNFTEELCGAISVSASACLSVCAYIVFFRVLAVLSSRILPAMTPVFSVLFEFSSGCAEGAALGGHTGIFMTGFAVGAAGLCVMMQNYNFIGRYGIPAKTLWLTKGIQGILCGAASVLFYSVYPLDSGGESAVFLESFSVNEGILMLSVLFLLSKFHKISNRGI